MPNRENGPMEEPTSQQRVPWAYPPDDDAPLGYNASGERIVQVDYYGVGWSLDELMRNAG